MALRDDDTAIERIVLAQVTPKLRVAALHRLVDSARLAAEIAPSAWGATLLDNGFRLNVGPVEAFVVQGDRVHVNLLASPGDPTLAGLPIVETHYQSMPSPQSAFVGTLEQLVPVLTRLSDAHAGFVRRAAVTKAAIPRKGSPFVAAHSDALMRFAARLTSTPVVAQAKVGARAFSVGSTYTRKDVFDILGLDPHPTGGAWFTGYTQHGPDWFIFCSIETSGRTGHNYGNHFAGDRLAWSGRTKSRLNQPAIQRLLSPEGHVYVFYRERDRDPFTFAGLARAIEWSDGPPVRVLWELSSPDSTTMPTTLAEEVGTTETVLEGAVRSVLVNVYERDPSARHKCIQHWGTRCVVCSFDFSERYGELGSGFIHVHHLRPLGEVGEQYELDPVADLRPVCPNCHAMLHRRTPALTISELEILVKGRLT